MSTSFAYYCSKLSANVKRKLRKRSQCGMCNRKTTASFPMQWFLWSCYPDSNRGPHPYQGCALPAELYQHAPYKVAAMLHRVDPYQGCALPTELYQHAASSGNGYILSQLEEKSKRKFAIFSKKICCVQMQTAHPQKWRAVLLICGSARRSESSWRGRVAPAASRGPAGEGRSSWTWTSPRPRGRSPCPTGPDCRR